MIILRNKVFSKKELREYKIPSTSQIKKESGKEGIATGAGIGATIGSVGVGGSYLLQRGSVSKNFDKSLKDYNVSVRKYRKSNEKEIKEINKKRRSLNINKRIRELKNKGYKTDSISISSNDKDLYNDLVYDNHYKSRINKLKEANREVNKNSKHFNSARYRKVTIGREVQDLNKKYLKGAYKPVLATTIIGTAAGLAKSRGELDKDHLRASLSINPTHIISGHLGINKGDEARKLGASDKDASRIAGNYTRNMDLATTGLVTAGIGITGKKIIKNSINKVANHPLAIDNISRLKVTNPELIQKAKGFLNSKKAGSILAGVTAVGGAIGAFNHGNKVRHIARDRYDNY